MRRNLQLDLIPGPGIHTLPCFLNLRNMNAEIIAQISISGGGPVEIELPVTEGHGMIVTLDTDHGGRTIKGDPRILNFRVFGFGWVDHPIHVACNENSEHLKYLNLKHLKHLKH